MRGSHVDVWEKVVPGKGKSLAYSKTAESQGGWRQPEETGEGTREATQGLVGRLRTLAFTLMIHT